MAEASIATRPAIAVEAIGRARVDAAHDGIVTGRLWHAAVGLAKLIALGVDGAEVYTTVA